MSNLIKSHANLQAEDQGYCRMLPLARDGMVCQFQLDLAWMHYAPQPMMQKFKQYQNLEAIMLESNIHDRGRKQARSNLGVFAHILAQSTIAEHKR